MIYTVTLNPAVDKTVYVDNFAIDAVNRASEVRQDAGGKGINVSKTIHELGGESTAIAFLGGATGIFIQEALQAMGIAVKAFEIAMKRNGRLTSVDKANILETSRLWRAESECLHRSQVLLHTFEERGLGLCTRYISYPSLKAWI